jgi:hypothetical protein
VLPVDLLKLDMFRANRWRRPICFSVAVSEAGLGWFRPYARLDGLFWRIIPLENPSLDVETLGANLLATYNYGGYADDAVRLEAASRTMGLLYHAPFMALIGELRTRGSEARCNAAASKYLEAMPPARLGRVASPSVEEMCGTG